MKTRREESGAMSPRRRHYEHCHKVVAHVAGDLARSLAKGKFRAESPAEWSDLLRKAAASIENTNVPPPTIERPERPAGSLLDKEE